jgi:hypothetical protein
MDDNRSAVTEFGGLAHPFLHYHSLRLPHPCVLEAVKKPPSITPEKERGVVKGWRKLEG